jgi:hypothetical protein
MAESVYVEDLSSVIVFEDKNFEAAIRRIIGKGHGDILKIDVCNIRSLSINNERISDITPLSNLVNLSWSIFIA